MLFRYAPWVVLLFFTVTLLIPGLVLFLVAVYSDRYLLSFLVSGTSLFMRRSAIYLFAFICILVRLLFGWLVMFILAAISSCVNIPIWGTNFILFHLDVQRIVFPMTLFYVIFAGLMAAIGSILLKIRIFQRGLKKISQLVFKLSVQVLILPSIFSLLFYLRPCEDCGMLEVFLLFFVIISLIVDNTPYSILVQFCFGVHSYPYQNYLVV